MIVFITGDYYHRLMDIDLDMKAFGEHLAKLRKRVLINDRRLTQEMLAGMLGLSTQQVRKYERGVDRPSPLTLRKICRIFNVSGDTILLLKTDPLFMNYDQLNPVHKRQIIENTRLLLAMEAKQWEEVSEDKKTADPGNPKKKVS